MQQNPPLRFGYSLAKWVGCFQLYLVGSLVAERDRWPLWLPVFLGAGVALYFALPVEPLPWPGLALCAAAFAASIVARRRDGPRWAFLAVAVAALGFSAACLRSREVAAPILARATGALPIQGRVIQVQVKAGGWQRVTLDRLGGPIPRPLPKRVRISFRPGWPRVRVGRRIEVRATLIPPPRPVMPGAYDFPRQAWFLKLGAVGMALGPARSVAGGDTPPAWELALNRLRQTIGDRVRAGLPGTDGTVAAAIVTGDTHAIPPAILAAYRNSGLAHILVIAGLHMGLVAALVFFLVRGGLALIPPLALRFPIKKWAAAAALLVSGFYLLLAGIPVPATRAFLMAALVLAAVMLDRRAVSMRLWALAAAVILLVEPEALVGASFQMSFAAVAALIATYEIMGPRLAGLRRAYGGKLAYVFHEIAGLALTSFAAGGATMVYAIYHFNSIALWQVAANVMAVPLVGVAVMPFAVASLALMPFGLERLALTPLGWGIGAVTRVAVWVSHWPHAVVPAPVLPVGGLILFSLGGLWLCLWRKKWRRWGLAAMVAGLLPMAFWRPPDILVDSHGASFGVRMADGALLVSGGGRMLKDIWGRRAGPLAPGRWPRWGKSGDGRLICDPDWCLYREAGRRVAFVRKRAGVKAACADSALVISAVPIRRRICAGGGVVIDRFSLWRHGARAIWLESDGIRVASAATWQGDRPWSFHPWRERVRRDRNGTGSDHRWRSRESVR